MAIIIKFPTKAKDVVSRPIHDALIKQREGGGKKMLSYLSGSTVIDLLNEAFGYLWSWRVEEQWIQESQPKKKYQSTEMEAVAPTAQVRGVLTIMFADETGRIIEISKSGFGSKTVLGGQADQEHVFKAAGTDALKKAASLFGIGAQLYRDEDEQAFFDSINYEDPWTDELLAQHEPSRTYIKQVMDETESTQEDIAKIIVEWSQGTCAGLEDLTPDNIVGFTDHLRTLMESSEEAAV